MPPLAGFFHDELFDTNGQALRFAWVLVKNLDTTNAKLYTTASMAAEASNPVQADDLGNVFFWAANADEYEIVVTPQGGTALPPRKIRPSLAPGQAARIDKLESDKGLIPSDYVLTRRAATYSILDGRTQVEVGSGPEPGALALLAINDLAPRGGRIDIGGREDFVWGSIPKLPAGLTRRLTIASTGPHVQLSTAAPRFLDPGSIDPNTGAPPPGSTYRNLSLDGIELDAAAIKTDDRGHHLLFGNSRNGSLYAQINFAGIRVRRCKVLNGRTAGGGADGQNALYFATHQTAAGQPQNFILDILVEDFEATGCLQALAVVGFKSGSWAGDPDMWGDALVVRKLHHDRGVVPGGFVLGGTHIHFGQSMRIGRAIVENVYGFGSQDIGVEINNYQDALIRNAEFDEYNGFAVLLTNFLAPRRLRDQGAKVENVSGRHQAGKGTVVADDASSLVCVQAKAGLPMGDTTVDGLKYYRNIARMAGLTGIGFRVDGEHRSVSAENVSVEAEGINHTSTTEQAFPKLVLINPLNMTPVKLRNTQVRATGTVAAGSAGHQVTGIDVVGSVDLDADVRVGLDLPGAADFSLRAVGFGRAATTLKGKLALRLLPMSATRPAAVKLTSGLITFAGRFDIVDSDFSANAVSAQDVEVSAANAPFVHLRPGSTWKTAKNPVGVTVGPSPFVYRNTSGFRQQVVIRGGTVTEVAYSLAGSAYTVIATTTGVIVTLENGEHLRITWNTTAPTVTAILVV